MKALSVFSGGLDSMLAAALIQSQGIEIQALFFETPFFSPQKAIQSAEEIGVPFKVINITDRHMEVLKNPRHGYGGNMNPCIDCHALMFRIAGEMLEQESAQFIITGEVLGQRPMSQNRKALDIVETESGLKGLILRPLSAKCLSPSLPEKKGWVDRDRLMNFSGRSRKPQIEYAKKLNITQYPSPAGGCLLTDKIFSRRLKDLFDSELEFKLRDIELLKIGRHFRINPTCKIIVGRNSSENQTINSLSEEDDLLLQAVSVPGPTVLVSGISSPETDKLAAVMTVSYSDAGEDEVTELRLTRKNQGIILKTKGRIKSELKHYMI
ncbi:MAG: tRNA 4-thiouridine(8) synthase ThiI [Deltaproteobacteria bacterium]|nr:tRNA 4-thiouridine(8) synthase ThiI [Deltaproteobacteria bacterium]